MKSPTPLRAVSDPIPAFLSEGRENTTGDDLQQALDTQQQEAEKEALDAPVPPKRVLTELERLDALVERVSQEANKAESVIASANLKAADAAATLIAEKQTARSARIRLDTKLLHLEQLRAMREEVVADMSEQL